MTIAPDEMLERRNSLLAEAQALFDEGREDDDPEIDSRLTDANDYDQRILAGPAAEPAFVAAQLLLAVALWDEGCPMPPMQIRALLTKLSGKFASMGPQP